MESLSRAVGSPLPMWVAGRLRLVAPLTLSMFGSVEMFLLDSRQSMTDIVAQSLSEWDEPPVELFDFAVTQDEQRLHFIAADDLHDFLGTPDGLSLAMWLMTRETEPAWDYEDIQANVRLCDEADQIKMVRSVQLVSAIDSDGGKDWVRIKFEDADTGQRMNWKHMVRSMCEAYLGMTPQEIGRMTLYNVRSLTLANGDVKGMRISRYEFRAMQDKGELDNLPIKWTPKKKVS